MGETAKEFSPFLSMLLFANVIRSIYRTGIVIVIVIMKLAISMGLIVQLRAVLGASFCSRAKFFMVQFLFHLMIFKNWESDAIGNSVQSKSSPQSHPHIS